MNESKHLIKPDLEIINLKIWIHDREQPNSEDYYEGNWLNITAECESNINKFEGSKIWTEGSYLLTWEIYGIQERLNSFYNNFEGTLEFRFMEEPFLALNFEAINSEKVAIEISISPDVDKTHKYYYQTDKSYILEIISQCKKILSKFPIKAI